jgi:hypothetical protein
MSVFVLPAAASDPTIRTTALEMIRVLNLDAQNERIVELCCKYHVYNQQVLDDNKELIKLAATGETQFAPPPIAPPQLYDLLLTGCKLPYAKHSQETLSQVSIKDAADILRLMPSAVKYRSGSLRCRDEVHCAVAVCSNLDNLTIKVLREVVPHLDWLQTYKWNCKPVTVLEDTSSAPPFESLCEFFPSTLKPLLKPAEATGTKKE